MTQGVPENKTITVATMSDSQKQTLGRVFKVKPDEIKAFRWGNSQAPSGHQHYQTTWLTLEYGEGAYGARETIRIDAQGFIIEHIKE